MNEVTISTFEYARLIRQSERIDALARYLDKNPYAGVPECRQVLCIEKKEEDEDDGEL